MGFLRVPLNTETPLDGLVSGLLVVHVDDCIFAGPRSFFDHFVSRLKTSFPFGSVEDASVDGGVRFTGTRFHRHSDGVYITQSDYIQDLILVPVASSRHLSDGLSWQEQAAFRSLLGALSWVAQRTRPDIAYEVTRLSSFSSIASVGNLRDLNRILKVLRYSCHIGIWYGRFASCYSGLRLILLSDASFGREVGLKSQGGMLILLAEDKCSTAAPIMGHLVSWRSWTLKRMATGSLSAEAQACRIAVSRVEWFSSMVTWAVRYDVPVDLRGDCRSLIDALTTCHSMDDRRLAVQLLTVKEALAVGHLRSIRHCPSASNYADGLTKRPTRATVELLQELMTTGVIRDIY
jgi:hypothetical protein